MHRIARLCAGCTLVAGVLVLFGWAFDIPLLKSVLPQAITMKANTAVALMLLAGGLLSVIDEEPGPSSLLVGRVCASIAALIAVLTLAEYLFGRDLYLDQAFFRDPDRTGRFPPGRLAPITAVNFLLLALAILVTRRAPRIAQSATLVAMVVAIQATLGYLFGVTYTFGSAYYTQIAIHTAVLFALLCLGLLLARPNDGFMRVLTGQTAGGQMARSLIGWTLVVPPALNWAQLLGQRAGLYDADFGILLRLMGNIVFFAFLVLRTASRLHEADLSRQEAERALAQSAGHLEQAVEERTAQLASVNREMEAFSYSVSHDLRAPLRALDGFARAVRDDAQSTLSDAAKRYLARVLAAAERMGQLIDDLLKLSRLTQKPMRIRELDVTALARAVAELLPVPVRVSDGLRASADEGLLRIALENLLGNAAKFSARNPNPSVEVFEARPGVLAVRDNGVGFDPAYADKLFAPFQRLHAATDFPGSGVGLATVQRVVQRHGGRVWAESQPGAGATFFLTLSKQADDRDPTGRNPAPGGGQP